MRTSLLWMLGIAVVALGGCGKNTAQPFSVVWPTGTNAAAVGFTNYTHEVIKVWPHDTNAFTEGLVFHRGGLLESTGVHGQSSLRKVDLQTGLVLQQTPLSTPYFAEGLTVLGTNIFQLTYLNGKCFVYELDGFRLLKEFSYRGEGWGLTTDGESLIMSDGTDRIRFVNPLTFTVTRTIRVRLQDQIVSHLNELEYVKGEIYANIWPIDDVVRINPGTGNVIGRIDFAGLLPPEDRTMNPDVLNGIAYDADNNRLYVTGKRWPKLFEVRLQPK
jgi:glutamine cyclotransferase